jgi:tight adherence protein B
LGALSDALPLALAGLGGAALALAAREAARASPVVASWAETALRALALAGSEGRPASEAERRRLGLLSGAALSLVAMLVFGPGPAALLAALGPVLAQRALGSRQRRYRRAFERRIPDLASTLADAMAAGTSLRNALIEAGPALDGPAAVELRRVAADLQLGSSPATALAALVDRLDSEPAGALVAAATSQQRSGGDLAALLRRYALAARARQRSLAAARSATAQARLTGGMVAAMPLAAALLVELASPGFIASLVGERASTMLVALALGLQGGGYLLIQRLGRVRG